MVSIPLRGSGYVKQREPDRRFAFRGCVSIPLRGSGYVKNSEGFVPGSRQDVSIPLRGSGYVKRMQKEGQWYQVDLFPSPCGAVVM